MNQIEKFQTSMPAENTMNASGWLYLSQAPYTNQSWYFPGHERTRGGKTSLYSEMAYKNCPGDGFAAMAPNSTYWKFDKV